MKNNTYFEELERIGSEWTKILFTRTGTARCICRARYRLRNP